MSPTSGRSPSYRGSGMTACAEIAMVEISRAQNIWITLPRILLEYFRLRYFTYIYVQYGVCDL